MIHFMKFHATLALLVACMLSLWVAPCKADFLLDLDVNTYENRGIYSYNYTITNTDFSPATPLLFTLSISVSSDADLQDIVVPQGWSAEYQAGKSSIEWTVDDTDFIISPGGQASFGFSSRIAPGESDATIFALLTDGSRDEAFRATTAPMVTAVPEPTSMIPMGTGLFALAGYTWHRRRRSAR